MEGEKLDYEKLGLRVGLELHQQLDTKHKLFCKCPTTLEDRRADFKLIRRLRPTQSELGEVDPAAMFEWKKGRFYVYEAYDTSTCLVEADEEPPHPINPEAVEVALTISLLLNATPVDEVHVMRKVVIDGSNTTGFQRTAIIALGGVVGEGGSRVRIQTVCLEEDAARKIGEEGRAVIYRLDRLGIPLIEIATAPDITSPEQAEQVAYKIGQLLRITGRVKRGIGTIRQDLNISIKGGNRIEVKGVQKLELIGKVVEYEVLRQLNLLKIKEELKERGLKIEDIKREYHDLTSIFRSTKCKIIRRVLESKGVVLGLKLPKMKGILSWQLQPNRRFGTELADYARYFSGVGGLFHSDELPKYGISREELEGAAEKLEANLEVDAIVLVADFKDRAEEALDAVVERVKKAFEGVPMESRAANPDGTTRFMRPQPGPARMYPETDVPPYPITSELIEKVKEKLPEKPEEKVKKYVEKYGLSEELANLMVTSYRLDLFEELAEKYGDKVPPTIIASTIESTIKYLKSEGYPVENLTDEHIEECIRVCAEGRVGKEAIPEMLKYLAQNPEDNVYKAIKTLGLESVSLEEVRSYVKTVVASKLREVREKGGKAFSIIMGEVMKKYRGRVDGRRVAEIVKEELKKTVET